MFKDPTDDSAVREIDSSYTSRVAEIFEVILKSLSIGIDFIDEEDSIYPLNNSEMNMHTLDNETYFCTDYQFFLVERMKEIEKDILEENPVITTEQLKKKIQEELKTRDYILGPSNLDEYNSIL